MNWNLFFLIVAFIGCLALSQIEAAPSDNFTVTFDEKPGLDHVCFYISITNNQDSNDDFPFKTIINETSLNMSIVDVRFYEWKPYEYDETECHECVVETCDHNKTAACFKETITDCVICGSTTSEVTGYRWLERNLVSRNEDSDKLSHQFEEVHIKKGLTARYKLCYDFGEIPTNPATGKPESYGYIWLDVRGKIYADLTNSSWWNMSCATRWRIIGNASSATLPIGVNATNQPNVWTQNSTEPIYLYDCGSYMAVGNETDELAWENASLWAGNSPTLVYEPDIVAVYHFEEINGTGWGLNDSTRYGNDLLHVNTPSLNESGVFGYGVNYEDGSSEKTSGPMEAYSTGTIMGWFKQEASAIDGLVGLHSGTWNYANLHFYSNTGANDALESRWVDTDSSTCYILSSNNFLKPTTWQHIAWIWNTTHCMVFLDGVRNKTAAITSGVTEAGPTEFHIGERGSNSAYWDGDIDEIIYSNRTWTDAEVTDWYNNGIDQLGRLGEAEELLFYNITLESPANGTITNDDTPDFSFRFNGTYATASCELWIGGTGYGVNGTALNDTSTTITANASISDGTNIAWYVNCTNNTVTQQSDTTRYITIDTADPNITVTSPLNGTTYTNNVNVDVSADETIDTWWYELDSNGTNTTFTPNITITGLAVGSHNISICANDTAGNINCTAVIFFDITSAKKTVCSVEPILITNQDNEEIEIGWGFDCDQMLEGTFLGDMIYGEMWYHNHTGTEYNFATDGLYYNLTFLNGDELNGFTFSDTDDTLTAQYAGTYKASYMASGDGQNNHEYFTSITINGAVEDKCESHKKMTAGGDIVTMTGGCIITLAAGDVLRLATADVGGTGTGNYFSANLNLIRIGD